MLDVSELAVANNNKKNDDFKRLLAHLRKHYGGLDTINLTFPDLMDYVKYSLPGKTSKEIKAENERMQKESIEKMKKKPLTKEEKDKIEEDIFKMFNLQKPSTRL